MHCSGQSIARAATLLGYDNLAIDPRKAAFALLNGAEAAAAEAFAQRIAIEQVACKSGRAARIVLAGDAIPVQHVAGEIERTARHDVRHAELAKAPRDRGGPHAR